MVIPLLIGLFLVASMGKKSEAVTAQAAAKDVGETPKEKAAEKPVDSEKSEDKITGPRLSATITDITNQPSFIQPTFTAPKANFNVFLAPKPPAMMQTTNPMVRNEQGNVSTGQGRQLLSSFADIFKYVSIFSGLVAQKLAGAGLSKVPMFEPFGMIVQKENIDDFLRPLANNLRKIGGLSTNGWIPCGNLNWYDGKGTVNNYTVKFYTAEQTIQAIKGILPYDATNGFYDVRQICLEACLPDAMDAFFRALKDKNPDVLKTVIDGAGKALGGVGQAAFGAATSGGDVVKSGVSAAEKGLADLIAGLIDAIGREVNARQIQADNEGKFNRAVSDVMGYLQNTKASWDVLEIAGQENETNGLTAPPYTTIILSAAHRPFNQYMGVWPMPLMFMYWGISSRKFKNNLYADDCASSWWTTNPNYQA